MASLSLSPTILSPTGISGSFTSDPDSEGIPIYRKGRKPGWPGRKYVCRKTTDAEGKVTSKCVKIYSNAFNPDTDGKVYYKQKDHCSRACGGGSPFPVQSSQGNSVLNRENQITAEIAYSQQISNISESGTNGKVMALAQQNIRSNVGVGLEYQLTRSLQTDPGITMRIGMEHGGTVDSSLDLGDAINSGLSTSDKTGYTLFHAYADISADFKATAMCKTVSPCFELFPDFVFEDTDFDVLMYAPEHGANGEVNIYLNYNAINVKCCGEARQLNPGVLASKTWSLPSSRVDFTFYVDGIVNPDYEFAAQRREVGIAVGSYIMENVSAETGDFQNTLLKDIHKLPGAWLDSKDCTMCLEPGDGGAISI